MTYPLCRQIYKNGIKMTTEEIPDTEPNTDVDAEKPEENDEANPPGGFETIPLPSSRYLTRKQRAGKNEPKIISALRTRMALMKIGGLVAIQDFAEMVSREISQGKNVNTAWASASKFYLKTVLYNRKKSPKKPVRVSLNAPKDKPLPKAIETDDFTFDDFEDFQWVRKNLSADIAPDKGKAGILQMYKNDQKQFWSIYPRVLAMYMKLTEKANKPLEEEAIRVDRTLKNREIDDFIAIRFPSAERPAQESPVPQGTH